jgi:hypothetical protein
MGAKTKLNTAYINGSLIGGGLIGLSFESMTAFVIATIFLIGCCYYNKDIRDMITLGYLCDYTIHVPIFNDDPTNKNICEHLLKNYRNIIIYCNSQKEGKLINKLIKWKVLFLL